MQSKNQKIIFFIAIFLTALVLFGIVKAAINLNVPGSVSPNFYTLEDIYQKITTGAGASTHSVSTLGSPSTTMHNLDDIFNAVPSSDKICSGTNNGTADCSTALCGTGTICNTRLGYVCANGVCKFENGLNCSDNDACASGFCNESRVCALNNPPGTPCSNNYECLSNICTNSTCVANNSNGNSCSNDYDCLSDKCSSGTCLGTVGNGNICYSNYDCSSGNCNGYGGICVGNQSYGSSCGSNSDCANYGYSGYSIACHSGTCGHLYGLGENCSNNYDCANDNCVDGHC